MEKNIGPMDKIIRFALAIALGIIGSLYQPWLSYLFLAIAVLLLITVFREQCLLYSLFGINTRK
jgi:hypothetical protein